MIKNKVNIFINYFSAFDCSIDELFSVLSRGTKNMYNINFIPKPKKKVDFSKVLPLMVIFSMVISMFPAPIFADLNTGIDSGNKIDFSTIIGLGKHQYKNGNYSKLQDAYRYIFNNIYTDGSKLLAYPEKFSASESGASINYDQGAVFNLDENDDLSDPRQKNKFEYFVSSTTAELGRAKALYDGNIAILDLEKHVNGELKNLTFESSSYCHILHTYIGKHEQCFSGMRDYEEYLDDEKFAEKEETSIVYFHVDDAKNGKLMNGNNPLFNILILPDLIFGQEDKVLESLGVEGQKAIRDFAAAGGTVFSTGKSSYLLEKIGLLADGTVDKGTVVRSNFNKINLNWNGKDDYESKLLKMGNFENVFDETFLNPENKVLKVMADHYVRTGAIEDNENKYNETIEILRGFNHRSQMYFLTNYFVNSENDGELNEVASYNLTIGNNLTFQNEDSLSSIERPADKMTAIAWKKYDKGKVVVINGNPASGHEKYYPYIFNSVFLSGAKSIIADLKVAQKTNPDLDDDIIPAYEKEVGLLGSFKVNNFFNKPIENIKIGVNIYKGFEIGQSDSLSNCEVRTLDDNDLYNQRLECVYDTIEAFEEVYFDFPVVMTDPYVTRKRKDIEAADGEMIYTRDGLWQETVSGGISYLQARNSSEIRGEYNPDPSSFYPLKGEGDYIDNVLSAQNRAHTDALDVEHIAVVPLISPVVDGNDQASLAYTLEFYNEYYQNKKTENSYVFPFEQYGEVRDYDYLDYKELGCSDVVLSPDWDTPVKVELMNRSEADLPVSTSCEDGSLSNIVGRNYAYSINNNNLATLQRFFPDAGDTYTNATQRQLVFLDTTKEKGARDYYEGSIPEEIRNGKTAKKKLVFARNDVYFYDNDNYPLPLGVEDNDIYISVDKMDECGDPEKGIVNPGYFDHEKEGGIKPNEYENELRCEHGKKKIHANVVEDYTNGKVELSHYLFPITDSDNINEVHDLADFNTSSNEHKDYSEVEFVKAHTNIFTLNPRTTPLGGKFVFTLPSDVNFNSDDPVGEGLINFSADHVAFREIEYNAETGEVIAKFIRGKMPNERYGKPDIMQVNFEDLDTDRDFDLKVELKSLEYDIGNGENMEIYKNAEFTDNMQMQKKPFLRMPSLILKFRLNRGENEDESYFKRYENMEPFIRYGVYIQELLKHRTVYGFAENHPVRDPGLVLRSGGFSTFSNIGASSIPFKEYLQTGIRQSVPASAVTSRIDYKDIWNRQWTMPARTVLPDVPPIPPPLRNFMINTTFEMRDMETGERHLEWASDREVEVLHKLKTVNNYPKYFDCTACEGNELLVREDKEVKVRKKYYVDISEESLYPNPNSYPLARNMPDNDMDGLPNYMEANIGSDENSEDTDGDEYLDGEEFVNGYNVTGEGEASTSTSSSAGASTTMEEIVEEEEEAQGLNGDNEEDPSTTSTGSLQEGGQAPSASSPSTGSLQDGGQVGQEVQEGESGNSTEEESNKEDSTEEQEESSDSESETPQTQEVEVETIEQVESSSDEASNFAISSDGVDHPENLYLKSGNTANYGMCYQSKGDLVDGDVLTDSERNKILDVELCESDDECSELADIPSLSKRPRGESGNWNHSEAVEDYYPENYINESMWSLTHYDYADNAFEKGYVYHMDNLLPNLDNINNRKILRPHNIIAQPMYKGLGYAMNYDRNYTSKFYDVEGNKITGWQSDNLQNKDDTLLGGQLEANEISVDKDNQMKNRFVEITNLENGGEKVDRALGNIYACLFNRWRAKVDPNDTKFVYPDNVYKNNVIPIIPELNKNDAKLTSYNCGSEYYTPENIHEIDNIKETYSKDWLYFGMGLRGGAKETINIVSKLDPIEGVAYEGATKINTGARFTYWNPANGPNSFIVTDNDVNIVEAKRSNIVVKKEIIPVEVPTFNADIYHLISVEDAKEHWRWFRDSPYTKHFGFGDASTGVIVGNNKKLKNNGSIINPGQETVVKIELLNNSGYDWNLIKSQNGKPAIEALELPAEAINANDYLYKLKHAIKKPIKFNFIDLDIPAEIKDYVEIIPSTYNIKVAGMLFDFENINATRIRDAYKGTYYLDLKLKDNFPDELRGRTFDIGVKINSEYFDKYPGHNSPVAHDYELEIPDIRFGVPFGDDMGWLAGRVHRVSGHSKNISITDEMPEGIEPIAIKRINAWSVKKFREVANDPVAKQRDMDNLFNKAWYGEEINFSSDKLENGSTEIEIDFKRNDMREFPLPPSKYGRSEDAKIYFLVKSKAKQLEFGESIVNKNLELDYIDTNGYSKTSEMSKPSYRKVKASGADLVATYKAEIIGGSTGDTLSAQKLFRVGANFVRADVEIYNNGSAIAYKPVVKVFVPRDVNIVQKGNIKILKENGKNIAEISLNRDMPPGDKTSVELILEVGAEDDQSDLLSLLINTANAVSDKVTVIEKVETEFDLTSTRNENRVTQVTAGSFDMEYADNVFSSSDISIGVTEVEGDSYKVKLTGNNISNPFYKLFIRNNDSEDFISLQSDYSSSGEYAIDLIKGETQIFGALYEKRSVLNESGEENEEYVKLAESSVYMASEKIFGGSGLTTVHKSFLASSISTNDIIDDATMVEVVTEAEKEEIKTSEEAIEISEGEIHEDSENEILEISICGRTDEEGRLVKATKIYYVSEGRAVFVPNLNELQKYAGKQIFDVSHETVREYYDETSEKSYPDGTLIRGSWIYFINSDKMVYLRSMKDLQEYSGIPICNINNQELRNYQDNY